MATILVRNFDDEEYKKLKADAKINHRSIVAEVKMRLTTPAAADVDADRARRWAEFRERNRPVKAKPGVKVQPIGDFVREMREER